MGRLTTLRKPYKRRKTIYRNNIIII